MKGKLIRKEEEDVVKNNNLENPVMFSIEELVYACCLTKPVSVLQNAVVSPQVLTLWKTVSGLWSRSPLLVTGISAAELLWGSSAIVVSCNEEEGKITIISESSQKETCMRKGKRGSGYPLTLWTWTAILWTQLKLKTLTWGELL